MSSEPSNLHKLLAECKSQGIWLSLDTRGGLTIDAPQVALTPDLLDRLKYHKAELMEFVEQLEERAAIIEFDAHLSREDAETMVRNKYFTK